MVGCQLLPCRNELLVVFGEVLGNPRVPPEAKIHHQNGMSNCAAMATNLSHFTRPKNNLNPDDSENSLSGTARCRLHKGPGVNIHFPAPKPLPFHGSQKKPSLSYCECHGGDTKLSNRKCMLQLLLPCPVCIWMCETVQNMQSAWASQVRGNEEEWKRIK